MLNSRSIQRSGLQTTALWKNSFPSYKIVKGRLMKSIKRQNFYSYYQVVGAASGSTKENLPSLQSPPLQEVVSTASNVTQTKPGMEAKTTQLCPRPYERFVNMTRRFCDARWLEGNDTVGVWRRSSVSYGGKKLPLRQMGEPVRILNGHLWIGLRCGMRAWLPTLLTSK